MLLLVYLGVHLRRRSVEKTAVGLENMYYLHKKQKFLFLGLTHFITFSVVLLYIKCQEGDSNKRFVTTANGFLSTCGRRKVKQSNRYRGYTL